LARPVSYRLLAYAQLTPQAPKAAPASPPKAAAPPVKKPAAASAKAGPSKSLASSPTEPVKYRYSTDDALAQAADLVPANFQTQLADAAWKVRLEAADEMIKWTEEEGAEKVDSEILIRFLGKYPGWNEKNFQVCQLRLARMS
jgi:cytoskeleton-associated protein 5